MRVVRLDLGAYAPRESRPGVGIWQYERPLPLTTDGHLRAFALGVGAAFSAHLGQSNYVIVKGETSLFIDLGTTASQRLTELRQTVHSIDDIVVTHSHADHIGSLEELALKRRFELPRLRNARKEGEPEPEYVRRMAEEGRSGRYRPRLHVPEFYARELWDMSLRGGLVFSEEVPDKGPEGGMRLEHFFDVLPMQEEETDPIHTWRTKVGDIDVLAFATRHVPDALATAAAPRMHSVGLVIDDRLYISGDTQFDTAPIERFGKNCEIFWHDVQDYPGGVHANYSQLKTLPEDVRARTYLTHLSDGMLDVDVLSDGFAGLLSPAPVVYDFD